MQFILGTGDGHTLCLRREGEYGKYTADDT